MEKLPEALRLADDLVKHLGGNTAHQAAAELRRLHEALQAERERAAMLCHQYRDVEYPAEAIAEAILRG